MDKDQKLKQRLVVIGSGMGGIAAIEAVIKTEADVSITLFGEEPSLHYNRILLSEVLAGKADAEKIVVHPKDWYVEHQIDFRRGVSVTSIDTGDKTVCDETGAVVSYDYLVLATGSRPHIPAIKGHDKKGVYTFWTMDDTEKMIAEACHQREAVVIGGGLLGLEAARALINYGVSVTVVHLTDRLMERQLDPAGASLLKQQIEQMGIRILLESNAEEILGDAQVSGVRLKGKGEILPAGMVLIATGTRPDTRLATATGLKVNLGIVVDDRMETSLPGIYALGDAIEHRGLTYGLIAPLKEQAQVFADAIIGKDERRYGGTECATTLKVAGIDLTSAGEFMRGQGAEEIAMLDSDKGIYKKAIIRHHRLKGYILLGDLKESARLFNLMRKGKDLSAIQDQLFGNGFGVDASAQSGALSSPASGLADADIVCNCNNVSKGLIVRSIREKGLKTRDAVAECTEATTGCGSCADLVDALLLEANPSVPSPLAVVSEKKEKTVSLKTLDLETIKQEGLGLDFTRIQEMGSLVVSPDDKYRLKTYGICVQKHAGYSMMRIRIPGGVIQPQQIVPLAEIADVQGRGRIHLTVRQSVELHWVRVEEATRIFETLRGIGLTTRSACGHTLRNVTACSHGAIAKNGILDVQPFAQAISDYFISRSDLINPTMPNRLNVYFSGCEGCAADAVINDIGFVAVRRDSKASSEDPQTGGIENEVGFELWVGGSLGAHPKLGHKIRDFLPLSDALFACRAVFDIHTRFGNRNKARSRLKFLIEQWGIDAFRERFDQIFLEKKGGAEQWTEPFLARNQKGNRPGPGKRLLTAVFSSAKPQAAPGVALQRQRGYARVTVAIPLGEITTEHFIALGTLAKRYGDGHFYLTKNQDIDLHWVPISKISTLIKKLAELGFSLKGGGAAPNVISCVGIEFCTLAVTHAQGAAREILNHYAPDDPEKRALLAAISIHISGCPNSCAKHQAAEIGLAGTMLPVGDARRYSYQLFLGGAVGANAALGVMVRKGITDEMVIPTLDALLDIVLDFREQGETFNEVMLRLGAERVAELLEAKILRFMPHSLKGVEMTPDFVEVGG